MDVDAALRDLVNAICDGDFALANEKLTDLKEARDKGLRLPSRDAI
jgi:hypothetical protein